MPQRRILLIGGGHSHLEVLRRFAHRPDPAIELTLVSPNALTSYSGMLPGLVAGHYTVAESHIDLPALAHWAQARFVCDRVVELDLYTRMVRLAEGSVEPFDLVSIDVGSAPDTSAPGAREHAIAVRPIDRFLAAWVTLQAEAAAGHVRTIVVVGGGAGGVEMLLAMQYRLAQALGGDAPRFALLTDQSHLLPQHSPAVRKYLGKLLVARDVVLHTASAAVAVEIGAVVTGGGRRIAADRVIWATSAAAPPWLAASSLACDERGFVRVNRFLQSVSDPFVFAAGDCATQDGNPRPKSGVFAVREGPPLAANLRRIARHEPLVAFTPQRRALSLIATGAQHAVASWGPIEADGEWIWRWKDRIDRRFCARYRPPLDAGAPSSSPGR
jgi:selenide,water dikinase